MTKIGILVVSYNQYQMIFNWINNYLNLFYKNNNLHLIILDNNSDDRTFNKLTQRFNYLDIRKLKENFGCTTGRNIGIVELDRLGCNYLVSLDADVIIKDSQFFDKLQNVINKNCMVDGFSPILKWSIDNSIQGIGARIKWHGSIKTVKKIDNNKNINILPGGAGIINIDAFKKYGLYDNDLPPIGSQDYEWGIRATKMGAKFQYIENLEVIHYHDKNYFCSPWTRKWILIGRIILLRKHFSLGIFLREIKYIIFNVKKFGIKLMFNSYGYGLKKKLNKNNYIFNKFAIKNINDFYHSDYIKYKKING
jgi:GT2 family glycosyltransferase